MRPKMLVDIWISLAFSFGCDKNCWLCGRFGHKTMQRKAKNFQHPQRDLLTPTVKKVVQVLEKTVPYWEMQGYTREL